MALISTMHISTMMPPLKTMMDLAELLLQMSQILVVTQNSQEGEYFYN
jgi:hypothetical protein